MAVNHLMHGESNIHTWTEHFGNRTWFRPRTLFSLKLWVYWLKARITIYMIYDSKQSLSDFILILSQQPTVTSCQFRDKVCGSVASLTGHMRMRRVKVNAKSISFFLLQAWKGDLGWGATCDPKAAICGLEEMACFSKGVTVTVYK